MAPEALRDNWNTAWRALGVAAADEALCIELQRRYGEPQRHYHTLQHLGECLSAFDAARGLAEHPDEVELALWFHDAIYDIKGHENEQRSADWARAALTDAGVAAEAAQRVHALVMATRHTAVPSGRDEQLLVDIDLSILGAERGRFDEYEQQIRKEYAYVPGFLFRRKRREILKGFLDRPAIYSTPYFHDALEARARENLGCVTAA
jgi:predicted metal-dependent HD superfamily phosphohydrolase